MPSTLPIQLTAEEERTLRRWARRGYTTRQRRRARIILQAAAGLSEKASAQTLATSPAYVARWRARFLARRLPGIEREAPRAGRPPSIPQAVLEDIVKRTTLTSPPGALRWSTRRLAREAGVSAKTVHRVWQANGLTPSRVPPQTLQAGGQIVEGLDSVIGRYLSRLDSALVLGGDRTRLRHGFGSRDPARRAPEAFARRSRGPTGVPARYGDLQIPTGHVIGVAPELSRPRDWLGFLRQVARRLPPGAGVQILADIGAVHQHPAVQSYLVRHPALQIILVRSEQPLPAWLARILQRTQAFWGDPLAGTQRVSSPPPRKLARRAQALAQLLWHRPLPPRIRQQFQRVGFLVGEPPAPVRPTLRHLVEARSPRLTGRRPLATWVANAEMLEVVYGPSPSP